MIDLVEQVIPKRTNLPGYSFPRGKGKGKGKGKGYKGGKGKGWKGGYHPYW